MICVQKQPIKQGRGLRTEMPAYFSDDRHWAADRFNREHFFNLTKLIQ